VGLEKVIGITMLSNENYRKIIVRKTLENKNEWE